MKKTTTESDKRRALNLKYRHVNTPNKFFLCLFFSFLLLMSASVTHAETPVIPVANFSSNVSSGYAPLSVQFNDSSENTTSWTWFFGDENYTQAWSEVNSSAGWSIRYCHSAVSLSDGSIVVMGGSNDSTYFNDTWLSTDGGETWSELNSSSGWSGRLGLSAVSLSDGSIVVMGGSNDSTYFNDVWRSIDGGSTWTEVTSSAGWSGRYCHSAVSLSDGSIVVMGGYDGGNYLNDTWRSTDGGETWSELNSSSGWSGRYIHSAVSLSDGSIVVMGGANGTTNLNDVWRSTDGGSTWIEVTSSAGWSARSSHSAVSLPDGSIVVTGGSDDSTNLNDVWRSTDSGSTWTEVNSSAGWSARNSHSAVSLSDGSIVVMGGFDGTNNFNDVWIFQFAGSTLQNPVHTYASVGNFTVTLTAINGTYSNSTESTITVTESPVLPVANFSSNVSSGSAPLSVEFTDLSENATEYNWDFGDGSNSTDQNPVHIYSDAGNFTVNLTVSNVNGTDSKTTNITVLDAGGIGGIGDSLPVASFSSNVTSGYAPLSVQFNDSSENATSWTWFFGDENYTQAWTEVNSSAGWSGRSSPAAVSLPDGSIVIMGGNDNDGNLNDTWRSTDGGETWSEMNSSAGWSARYGHTAVLLPDGSIVIMGGSDNDGNLNDTWRSIDGGETWSELNSSSGWSARYGHTAVSLPDGSIVIMGGSDNDGNLNDVWRSTDGGATWIEMNSSAGWSGRSSPAAVSLSDGSIFVMGGTDGFTYFNDVWRSTDGGATWTEVNSSAGWSGRYSHSAVSLSDGSLVVMGGTDSTNNLNDTWRSTDGGETWTEVNSSAGWSARYLHSAVSLSDGSLVVLGGYNGTNLNDVWRFQLAGSTLQNPTHTYTSAGNYTVILTVSNSDGYDTLSRAEHVSVLPALEQVFPVANFTSNVSSGSAPLSVQFTDLSANASSWTWDFGDSSNSTDLNPVHVFSTAGNFTVNLTVSNLNGTDSIESTITVTDEPVLPVANFSSNVTEGYAPLSVEFTDLSENADEWSWDFGDGSDSIDQNPVHVFSTAGNYTVNLTVSNLNGTDSIESIITVTDEPVLPVANFTSNVSSGYVPLTVEFTDSSENADEWIWDFGDGSNSTDQNPIHTYSDAGNYTVNLTVSNLNGTDSKLFNITVTEAPVLPVANFSSNVSSGNAPLSVEFTDLSENVTSWIWDFGDGNNSTDQNTTHTYYVAGNYTVNLTVSNLNGTDSIESTISVTASPVLPVANFSSNVTDGYVPLTVEFTDLSENADEWIWDFGDGTNSTDQNPVHVFSTAGNYTVNLTVSNVDGTDSTESVITVTEAPVLPVANFSSNVSSGYAPLTVEFTDSSENADEWIWDFGDGSNSTDQNPIHTYSDAGNYTVNLTVSNLNGTDSKLFNITVAEHFYAYSIDKTVTDVSGNGSSANVTKAGDVISYQINVTNDGTLNLTSVNVIDSFINLTGPVESLHSNDILEVGENWIYTGNYTVSQEDLNNNGGGDGFIDNTATVNCTELDEENDSVLVPIEQNPNCTIKKFIVDIAGNGPQGNISSAGDVIEFHVNLTNSGNVDLSNISVRDSLINLTGPYGDIGLFGLYQSSLVQYPSGDGILSVGETWYYLGNYTITQEDLNNNGGGDGFLNSTVTFESSETEPINETTVQYVDESGNESGNFSPGIYIEWNPNCSFNKSVLEVVNGDNGAVDDAGDVIRYGILVENEGNVELTGVSVSDPIISLVGPVESLNSDGVLELGENWTYTGNYTVTEDDMDSEGDGDEDIDNTATLSCNELPNKTSSAEVELIIPESSGGSSHSSGGSGGSPEPSTNIEVKEISQTFVTNGKAVQFDFTKNATCVVYVGFDSRKTAGKTTTIAEQLKKKSTLTSNLTDGEVYKYFNVWVGNSGFVSSDNMENMNICFKVSKSWLQNENIDPDSITLNRYSNKTWKQLPVSLLKEDSKYLYFTADVPGYSFFAITGKSNASHGGSVTEIKPEEETGVKENTGNDTVKPETTDKENAGESGSKFGISSLIAFLLIACLAVAFLYLRKQEGQK